MVEEAMAVRYMACNTACHIAKFPSRAIFASSSIPRLCTQKSSSTRLEIRTFPSEDASDQYILQGQEWNGGALGDFDVDTWKLAEAAILQEIEPVTRFVKRILHSERYKDGELLSLQDQNKIVEKLLPYHPRLQDKIGCGVDSIMVGRHPEFESSRCLFIIQKDGRYTDFSYKKCLMGFIKKKYPSFAEKFISTHFRKR